MILGIVGSRSFNNYNLFLKKIEEIGNPDKIISGGTIGADKMAERYAFENNIEIVIYKPDWKKHGPAAGPIRNKSIVENSDIIIAFWDGVSKGTLSSINMANKLGKKLIIVDF